ncbi:MAG: hypothetical protein U1E17_01040 [Geminicoccaceae bacterium]
MRQLDITPDILLWCSSPILLFDTAIKIDGRMVPDDPAQPDPGGGRRADDHGRGFASPPWSASSLAAVYFLLAAIIATTSALLTAVFREAGGKRRRSPSWSRREPARPDAAIALFGILLDHHCVRHRERGHGGPAPGDRGPWCRASAMVALVVPCWGITADAGQPSTRAVSPR